MNMFIFLDLWLIIKNPFKSAEQRRKEFVAHSLIFAMISLLYNFLIVYNNTQWLVKNEYQFDNEMSSWMW